MACSFFFLSGTGTVMPPPSPPRAIAAAAPVEPKAIKPKAGKNILGRNEILELQTQLKALGLSPDPLDGVAGPWTAAAVRRYEESRGKLPTGFVDRDLLKRLQREPPSRPTSRQGCGEAGTHSQKPSQ